MFRRKEKVTGVFNDCQCENLLWRPGNAHLPWLVAFSGQEHRLFFKPLLAKTLCACGCFE
jgi:hypothetical protein